MNRYGVKSLREFVKIIRFLEKNNIELEGVYTHFSSCDIDEEYTLNQIEVFRQAVDKLKKNFDLKYVHSEASPGLKYNVDFCNLIRPGIVMYGHKCYRDFDEFDRISDVVVVNRNDEKVKQLKTEIYTRDLFSRD